jgi:hypothetical protein
VAEVVRKDMAAVADTVTAMDMAVVEADTTAEAEAAMATAVVAVAAGRVVAGPIKAKVQAPDPARGKPRAVLAVK